MQIDPKYTGNQAQAIAFRDAGDMHLMERDYRSAIRCYHKCILHAKVVQQMPESYMSGAYRSDISMRRIANELVTHCYMSLTVCLLEGPPRTKEDYLRAVGYCELVNTNQYVKVDYERITLLMAKAFVKAGMLIKATKQLKKIENNNAEAKALLAQAEIDIDIERKRRNAEIKANFARNSANAPVIQAHINGQASTSSNGHTM